MAEILSIGELLDLGGSASTAGLIPYSALEYSAQKITAISGTAIGGNVDSGTVTAIVNSSVSGKVDQSAFDQCCSSMSSVVSSLETSVTSMSSVVSGLTGDYLEKTASSMFQPSGDYAYSSSLSSYLPGSASSQFAPSADYAYNSALSAYQPSGDYAFNSALSSKLDESASSQFAPSGDYAYNSALSAYQPSGDYAFNSALSSKLDESAFTAYTASAPTAGHTYTGVDPIVVDNTADTISLSASSIYFDSSMRSYVSGGSGFVGVNGSYLSGVAHDTSLSGDGSEAYPLGVSNYVGKYTSPSATIDIDNANGTLEATRYAIRHLPAVSLTGVLSTISNHTAILDYQGGVFDGRSATLKFTDITSATQFKVSGVTLDDETVYKYIGSGTSITIPSSIGDLLYISADSYRWTANVTLSASSEPDRVEPLLYSSDRCVNSIIMHSAGYPYIVGLNKHPISASRAESANSAGHADNCVYADSAMSAGSANKAVSAQAALKYFYGLGDTGFISADFYSTGNPSGFTNYLPNFGYNGDGGIASIDGSAVAGGWDYTSPSGTIAVDNANGTLESMNSSMRVDEQVTPASSVSGSGYNLPYSARLLNHMTSLPGDTLYTNLMILGGGSASAAFYGSIVNGGSAVLTSMIVSGSGGGFTYYSATVPLNESYSAIYLSASAQWGTPPELSATATVEHPGSTAYLSSVYEQVLKDSMWQSLTAWAVAQGWTP